MVNYSVRWSLHKNIWLQNHQSESSIPPSRVINTFYCLKPKPPPWTSRLIYFYEGAWWPSLRNRPLTGRWGVRGHWIILIPTSRICIGGITSAPPPLREQHSHGHGPKMCVSMRQFNTWTHRPTHPHAYIYNTHTHLHIQNSPQCVFWY